MVNEIKTIEDRKKSLIKKGKANGYVTYEEMAEELKGLENEWNRNIEKILIAKGANDEQLYKDNGMW